MEMERKYRVHVEESYREIARVDVTAATAQEAADKAVEMVREAIKCGHLSVGRIECLSYFEQS